MGDFEIPEIPGRPLRYECYGVWRVWDRQAPIGGQMYCLLHQEKSDFFVKLVSVPPNVLGRLLVDLELYAGIKYLLYPKKNWDITETVERGKKVCICTYNPDLKP